MFIVNYQAQSFLDFDIYVLSQYQQWENDRATDTHKNAEGAMELLEPQRDRILLQILSVGRKFPEYQISAC